MNVPENFEVFVNTLQNGFYDMTELLLESHKEPVALVNFVIPSSFECDDETNFPDYLTTFEGLSPLTIAVETGDVELVKLLLSYGATVNHSRGCISALSIAIEMGTQDIFDLLIESNAPLDWRDPAYGWTLLLHAIVYNRPAMVATLLERGIDYRIPTSTGISPLICAARLHMWSAVEQLIDKIPLLPPNPFLYPLSTQTHTPVPHCPDISICVPTASSQEHEMLLQLLPCVHVSIVAAVLSRRYQALASCPRRRHQIARYSFAASLAHAQRDTTDSCPYDAEGMGRSPACAIIDIPHTRVDISCSPSSSSSTSSSSSVSRTTTNPAATAAPATSATATTTTSPTTTATGTVTAPFLPHCGCPPCKCTLPSLQLAPASPPTQPVPLLLDIVSNDSPSAASTLGSLRNVSLDPTLMDLGERSSRVMRVGYHYGLRRAFMGGIEEGEEEDREREEGEERGEGENEREEREREREGERDLDEERVRVEAGPSITAPTLGLTETLAPVPASVSESLRVSTEANDGICVRCADGWWDTEAVWGSQGCLRIGKKTVARGSSGENDLSVEDICKKMSTVSVLASAVLSTQSSHAQTNTNPELEYAFLYCRGPTMLHHILEHCAPRAPDADVAGCLRMVLSYALLVLIGSDCSM